MGRGKGGSTSYGKRTPGGIRTSSKMSQVGEIEAKHGVLGEDSGATDRVSAASDKVDWDARTAKFQENISGYDKDRRIQLGTFWNKYVKAAKKGEKVEEPDPEVLNNDIERCLLQWKRNRKKKAPLTIKKLDDYKTHADLHHAMAGYMTAAEEKARTEELAKSGAQPLYDDGEFKAYTMTTPEALSEMAQGTHWCTKDLETAADKLEDYDYKVVTRNGKSLFAIKLPKTKGAEMEILANTDFELVGGRGQAISSGNTKQPLVDEEYGYLKDVLRRLKAPELDDKHIEVIDEKEKRRRLESAMTMKDENEAGFVFASLGVDEIDKEDVAKMIETAPAAAAGYIRAARKRLPEFEEQISKSQWLLNAYVHSLSSRFPAGEYREAAEELLARDPAVALGYARLYGGRFEAAERGLAQDPWIAAMYSQMLGTRFPEPHRQRAEQAIAEHGPSAVRYARFTDGRFPGDSENLRDYAELNMTKDVHSTYAYAELNGGRFPGKHRGRAEMGLAQDPDIALKYMALNGGKFPDGFPVDVAEKTMIRGGADSILKYAKLNGGRFPKNENNPGIRYNAERRMSDNDRDAVAYATLNGGRFPHDPELAASKQILEWAENNIAQGYVNNIIRYARLNGGRFPGEFVKAQRTAEDTLASTPHSALEYAEMNGGRFPGDHKDIQAEAEKNIARDLKAAMWYAEHNGGRFPGEFAHTQQQAEQLIARSPAAILEYARWNGGKFPGYFRDEAEKTILKYHEQEEYEKITGVKLL